jgi:hypothetical protein
MLITNYILIDFENVQPKDLSVFDAEHLKIIVFVGANQKKVPVELAKALQPFGSKAEYIQITSSGANALDFHIAFYIGWLVKQDSSAHFYIISKDKGFDPLIRHLKAKGIPVTRLLGVSNRPLVNPKNKIMPVAQLRDANNIPLVKSTNKKSSSEKIEIIIENFQQRGSARPRTVKTLSSTINSLFPKKLSDKELTILINALKNKKFLTVSDTNKVSYTVHK